MVVATVVCMACIAVASSFITSLAWAILCGGLVCTSVLSPLCIVLRLACTSVFSTLCMVWYCHALMFLAHDVLFEISLTNFEALSIQVNELNSTCQPLTLTYDSNKLEILKIMLPVAGVKINGDFFCINLIPKLGMMMTLVQRLTLPFFSPGCLVTWWNHLIVWTTIDSGNTIFSIGLNKMFLITDNVINIVI